MEHKQRLGRPLTPAQRKARQRERERVKQTDRDVREQAKDDALRRIRTEARTIREARKIAAAALGKEK